MKARIQNHINEHDAADCAGEELKHFPHRFLKVVNLTKQQKELLVLGDELKKNIAEPNSPFQKFPKILTRCTLSLFRSMSCQAS